VRNDFTGAVVRWRNKNGHAGVTDFIARYRQLSALLERADEVVACFAEVEWRVVSAA